MVQLGRVAGAGGGHDDTVQLTTVEGRSESPDLRPCGCPIVRSLSLPTGPHLLLRVSAPPASVPHTHSSQMQLPLPRQIQTQQDAGPSGRTSGARAHPLQEAVGCQLAHFSPSRGSHGVPGPARPLLTHQRGHRNAADGSAWNPAGFRNRVRWREAPGETLNRVFLPLLSLSLHVQPPDSE